MLRPIATAAFVATFCITAVCGVLSYIALVGLVIAPSLMATFALVFLLLGLYIAILVYRVVDKAEEFEESTTSACRTDEPTNIQLFRRKPGDQ